VLYANRAIQIRYATLDGVMLIGTHTRLPCGRRGFKLPCVASSYMGMA